MGDHAAGPMYSFPPCYHVFSVHESAVPVLWWLMERLADTNWLSHSTWVYNASSMVDALRICGGKAWKQDWAEGENELQYGHNQGSANPVGGSEAGKIL